MVFPLLVNSTGPGQFMVCVLYDGNTQRFTESGFMEKPEIEPATPGLQSIGLPISYTTAASLKTYTYLGC